MMCIEISGTVMWFVDVAALFLHYVMCSALLLHSLFTWNAGRHTTMSHRSTSKCCRLASLRSPMLLSPFLHLLIAPVYCN